VSPAGIKIRAESWLAILCSLHFCTAADALCSLAVELHAQNSCPGLRAKSSCAPKSPADPIGLRTTLKTLHVVEAECREQVRRRKSRAD